VKLTIVVRIVVLIRQIVQFIVIMEENVLKTNIITKFVVVKENGKEFHAICWNVLKINAGNAKKILQSIVVCKF
jgi:transketolase N-terminal domain/subunit